MLGSAADSAAAVATHCEHYCTMGQASALLLICDAQAAWWLQGPSCKSAVQTCHAPHGALVHVETAAVGLPDTHRAARRPARCRRRQVADALVVEDDAAAKHHVRGRRVGRAEDVADVHGLVRQRQLGVAAGVGQQVGVDRVAVDDRVGHAERLERWRRRQAGRAAAAAGDGAFGEDIRHNRVCTLPLCPPTAAGMVVPRCAPAQWRLLCSSQ